MTIARKVSSFAVLCTAFVASAADAQTAAPPAAGAQTAAPLQATEREWISISGTVVSTQPESFRLDYGKGIVTVMVPNWDWLREGRKLIDNHRVTVYGRVDASVQEKRRLEAAGLYDQDLGTYFDIDRDDRESHGLWTMTKPLTPGYIEVAGRVVRVSGRELVLNSGVRVDTRELGYDPVDDKGYPQIGPGDRIKAAGYLAKDILEGTELVAAWIVALNSQESS